MTVTDEEIRRLRELPGGIFRVFHVWAITGVQDRRVAVYAKDQPSKVTWFDNPEAIVQFNEGDEMELIPHANWGSAICGPHCKCPDCARPL